jgi:hypothetical protein
MLISELFDTPAPSLQWQNMQGSKLSQFELEGTTYFVIMHPIKKGGMLYNQFRDNPPVTDNTWYYAFAPMDPTTGQPSNSRFPSDAPKKLFGTVINIAIKFVQQHNVDMLYYGGDKNDPVRLRIYDNITRRMTRKYGWELVGEGDASFMGVLSHFWYIRQGQ